jgi:hypothetical protein
MDVPLSSNRDAQYLLRVQLRIMNVTTETPRKVVMAMLAQPLKYSITP